MSQLRSSQIRNRTFGPVGLGGSAADTNVADWQQIASETSAACDSHLNMIEAPGKYDGRPRPSVSRVRRTRRPSYGLIARRTWKSIVQEDWATDVDVHRTGRLGDGLGSPSYGVDCATDVDVHRTGFATGRGFHRGHVWPAFPGTCVFLPRPTFGSLWCSLPIPDEDRRSSATIRSGSR